MAVEVTHQSPYILESAASNPDFAVFFRHYGSYALMSSVSNPEFSVFMQENKFYNVSGGKRPNEWTVNVIKLYSIMAPAVSGDRPTQQELFVYGLFGGKRSLQPRIEQAHISVYEVFTT